MLKIDEVAYHNALAQKNPYIKCALGMGLLLLSISFHSYALLALILLLVNILVLGIARISFKFYLKLLSIPLIFLLLSTSMILFTFSKEQEVFIGAISCFGWYIGYTKETLEMAIYLFVRCMAAISCMYFMTLTVSMNQMVKVLKKCHLPQEFIELMILMYRFIFILLEEMENIKLAQEMRFGYKGLRRSYHSTALLIKLLMKRVMMRYKELCVVLEIKLYQGTFY